MVLKEANAPQTALENPSMPIGTTEEEIGAAWRILEHNRAFNTHFDTKFGPILTTTTAAIALLGALLKDRESLLVAPLYGPLIIALAAFSFVCYFLAFLNVLSANSPSLTSLDKFLIPWGGLQRDKDPASLVYFDDIKRTISVADTENHARYNELLRERLATPERYLRDLSDQIVEISAITSKKAQSIKSATGWLFWGLLGGGLTFAVTLLAKAVQG